MKKVVFFCFIFCVATSIFAQRFTSFSNDPSLTIGEMKEFAATVPDDRKKEAAQLVQEFTAFWESDFIDEQAQQDFLEISNMMLRRKMRMFPHFKSYIKAYNSFIMSELVESEKEWLHIIQYHLKNDAGTFHEKMENYVLIFSGNILFQNANSRWTVKGTVDAMGVAKEPFFTFSGVDLVGNSKQDSVEIIGTRGTYFPGRKKWEGKGGEVYWYRAGLTEDVKAQLSDYQVDTRYSSFEAENVKMYYPDFFKTPILGTLKEKAYLEVSEEKATYPRFKSYDNLLVIKNIYKNVDYLGGFEIRGASILGSATNDTLAQLMIMKSDTVVVRVSAQNYLFKQESVLASDARVIIYIEDDSIYHPGANFRYNETNGEMIVSRTKNGIGRSPFFDSYHKMDIFAETISWIVEDETIEIKPLPGQTSASVATFESQNFFNAGRMRKLQGYNEENPLLSVWTVFRSNGYEKTSINDFIRYFNKSPEDIKRLMIELAAEGFIEYDAATDEISYRKKIAQYLNNDVGKKDYDNLVLESKTHYAALSLLDNDLRISGCEFFTLSEAQIVNVYPSAEKVTVKKNRDMAFSGRVIAGLFDFVSHSCKFSYDQFSVTMDVIDSMLMYVEDKTSQRNMYGEYHLRKVRSAIEDLSGTLYIDLPGNKSGTIDIPEYPKFESRKGGKVYYDKPYVHGGAYHRDKFYYLVDIFTIKNLDNFATDSINYNGRLVSGGIFPDIVQPLKVRPDFSLGFVHKTDASGLSAYEGAGQYAGVVDLSNRGLRGKGRIDYLTSQTESDSLLFFLETTTGRANSHVVAEQQVGTEFPAASVKNADLKWLPYEQEMYVFTQKTPMTIFGETKLTGNSKLTPNGMFGTGIVKFNGADITAQQFLFKHHELLSDAADLQIYNKENEVAFKTDDYRSHIDFKTRKGHFVSNGAASEILFVKNELKTTASDFYWEPIDEEVIKIKWEDPYKAVDINNTPAKELIDMLADGNDILTTNPEKKKLKFNALEAEFNFSNNIINLGGVRFINVADAAIVPFDGKVTIYEKADIELLQAARLVAGRENKFHELYNVRAKILTGQDFRGSGDYNYIDENEQIQQIHFDTLWAFRQTKGLATIASEREFKFSPHFGFSGRAELNSEEQFLTFVGGVSLLHDCDEVQYAPMQIHAPVNPNDILIAVGERTKDVNNRKVVNAIASTNKEGRIYTCFGAAKDQFNDSEYISVFGYITFDKETQQFKAASLEKLRDPSLPENIITLNKETCISQGSGHIDMGAKLGRIDFITNGTITNYMKADSAEMNLTTSIDFYFNEKSMEVLTNSLSASYTLDFVDFTDDASYEMALINIMGEKEYDKYHDEVLASGQVKKLPKSLQVKFLFSNIDFVWDKETKSFVSQTSLPLIICGSKEINKMVPGRIVIEKRGSRNKLYIYFEFDDQFFFFQFENNSMYGFSSEKKFMDAIMAVDAKKRTLSAGDGKPSFTYKWGNRSQKNKFVKKFYNMPKDEEEEED